MNFKHLGELANHFAKIAEHIGGGHSFGGGGELHHALEKIGKHLEKKAKKKIGHLQIGWDKLADSTEAEKVRQGHPANAPLLRTGELRESISHEVEGHTVTVGSTDEVMVYHEFGTHKMPPRPVFQTLCAENAAYIQREAEKAMAAAMAKR